MVEVQADQRKLTIHAGLVHKLSAPLDALMNNGCMKQAVSRTATIDDVEEETFIAFCEFGYKGKYTTPYRKDKENDGHFDAENQLKDSNPQQEPEPEPEPGPELQDPEPEDTSSYVWGSRASKKAQKKKKSYVLDSIQHGSKSDSPPTHRDSFSNPLLKRRYTYYG